MNLYVVAPSAEALNAEFLAWAKCLARRLELDDERTAGGNKEDPVRPTIHSPLDVRNAKLVERIFTDLALNLRLWPSHYQSPRCFMIRTACSACDLASSRALWYVP